MYKSCIDTKKLLEAHPLQQNLIRNPLLKDQDRQFLVETFLPKELTPFCLFLITKKRLGILQEILEAFLDKVRIHKKISQIHLETAHPLTGEQRKALESKLAQLLPGQTIDLMEEINPRLWGGFRLTLDGQLLDLSLITHTHQRMQETHV